jgi:hypothetical protein
LFGSVACRFSCLFFYSFLCPKKKKNNPASAGNSTGVVCYRTKPEASCFCYRTNRRSIVLRARPAEWEKICDDLQHLSIRRGNPKPFETLVKAPNAVTFDE